MGQFGKAGTRAQGFCGSVGAGRAEGAGSSLTQPEALSVSTAQNETRAQQEHPAPAASALAAPTPTVPASAAPVPAASAPAAPPCALVALVGAGPGDPGLITVRGRDLLVRADVVVHDRLVASELLALAAHAKLVNVGKEQGSHPVPQHRINEILVEEARAVGAGGLVVRLKGGDPYLFGRGGEEASYLVENGVPFEVVPGVTSAFAAPAYAGVPVTDRRASASVHVVTGHRQANGALGIDFDALVRAGGTCVFLMAVATMGEICAGLLQAGMGPETPAAVVERGTTPEQRSVCAPLGRMANAAREAGVKSPAVLVVGEVARFSPDLGWYDRLPLRGRVALVTRPRDRAQGLVDKLAALGARVAYLPCIETRQAADEVLACAAQRLPRFGWVVLTSTYGVRCLFCAIEAAGIDVRALAAVRVAAIGSATAEALRSRGVHADYVPEVYDGAHLGRGLAERICAERGQAPADEKPVLLFRSASGADDLPRELVRAGVPYEQIDAYETVLAPEEPPRGLTRRLREGGVDFVTFTSASTVKGFARALGLEGPGAPGAGLPLAVCLGASTRAAAEACGFACVSAERATIDSLVEACVKAARAF